MSKIIRFFLRNVPRKYLQMVALFCTRTISIFYMGSKVHCPVCKKHYRQFLPYGYVASAKNRLCPNCLSLERHRLIWIYLQEKTNFFQKPLRFLHIAPEFCFLKRFEAQKNIDYITGDLESPWAKVKMDVHQIPFPNNDFDMVMCNHVLEHVEDDKLALSEIWRVLRNEGWGILLVPLNANRDKTYEDKSITNPKEREKHFGQHDHVREYGVDYPFRLVMAGFEIEEFGMSAELAQKYAIPLSEKLYIVRKQVTT